MIRDPALVVVDMQRDFCQPGGAHDQIDGSVGADTPSRSDRAGWEDVQRAVDATGRFLGRYRASGRTPILVRTLHDEHTNDGVWAAKYADRPMPCRPGTEGAEFVEELAARPSDAVVTKHRYSAFHGTNLDLYLDSNDVTTVLVAGVVTNVCVESTVRSAFDSGYEVTVLSDCTGSREPALSDASFDNMAAHFAAVRESGDVDLARWE